MIVKIIDGSSQIGKSTAIKNLKSRMENYTAYVGESMYYAHIHKYVIFKPSNYLPYHLNLIVSALIILFTGWIKNVNFIVLDRGPVSSYLYGIFREQLENQKLKNYDVWLMRVLAFFSSEVRSLIAVADHNKIPYKQILRWNKKFKKPYDLDIQWDVYERCYLSEATTLFRKLHKRYANISNAYIFGIAFDEENALTQLEQGIYSEKSIGIF